MSRTQELLMEDTAENESYELTDSDSTKEVSPIPRVNKRLEVRTPISSSGNEFDDCRSVLNRPKQLSNESLRLPSETYEAATKPNGLFGIDKPNLGLNSLKTDPKSTLFGSGDQVSLLEYSKPLLNNHPDCRNDSTDNLQNIPSGSNISMFNDEISKTLCEKEPQITNTNEINSAGNKKILFLSSSDGEQPTQSESDSSPLFTTAPRMKSTHDIRKANNLKTEDKFTLKNNFKSKRKQSSSSPKIDVKFKNFDIRTSILELSRWVSFKKKGPQECSAKEQSNSLIYDFSKEEESSFLNSSASSVQTFDHPWSNSTSVNELGRESYSADNYSWSLEMLSDSKCSESTIPNGDKPKKRKLFVLPELKTKKSFWSRSKSKIRRIDVTRKSGHEEHLGQKEVIQKSDMLASSFKNVKEHVSVKDCRRQRTKDTTSESPEQMCTVSEKETTIENKNKHAKNIADIFEQSVINVNQVTEEINTDDTPRKASTSSLELDVSPDWYDMSSTRSLSSFSESASVKLNLTPQSTESQSDSFNFRNDDEKENVESVVNFQLDSNVVSDNVSLVKVHPLQRTGHESEKVKMVYKNKRQASGLQLIRKQDYKKPSEITEEGVVNSYSDGASIEIPTTLQSSSEEKHFRNDFKKDRMESLKDLQLNSDAMSCNALVRVDPIQTIGQPQLSSEEKTENQSNILNFPNYNEKQNMESIEDLQLNSDVKSSREVQTESKSDNINFQNDGENVDSSEDIQLNNDVMTSTALVRVDPFQMTEQQQSSSELKSDLQNIVAEENADSIEDVQLNKESMSGHVAFVRVHSIQMTEQLQSSNEVKTESQSEKLNFQNLELDNDVPCHVTRVREDSQTIEHKHGKGKTMYKIDQLIKRVQSIEKQNYKTTNEVLEKFPVDVQNAVEAEYVDSDNYDRKTDGKDVKSIYLNIPTKKSSFLKFTTATMMQVQGESIQMPELKSLFLDSNKTSEDVEHRTALIKENGNEIMSCLKNENQCAGNNQGHITDSSQRTSMYLDIHNNKSVFLNFTTLSMMQIQEESIEIPELKSLLDSNKSCEHVKHGTAIEENRSGTSYLENAAEKQCDQVADFDMEQATYMNKKCDGEMTCSSHISEQNYKSDSETIDLHGNYMTENKECLDENQNVESQTSFNYFSQQDDQSRSQNNEWSDLRIDNDTDLDVHLSEENVSESDEMSILRDLILRGKNKNMEVVKKPDKIEKSEIYSPEQDLQNKNEETTEINSPEIFDSSSEPSSATQSEIIDLILSNRPMNVSEGEKHCEIVKNNNDRSRAESNNQFKHKDYQIYSYDDSPRRSSETQRNRTKSRSEYDKYDEAVTNNDHSYAGTNHNLKRLNHDYDKIYEGYTEQNSAFCSGLNNMILRTTNIEERTEAVANNDYQYVKSKNQFTHQNQGNDTIHSNEDSSEQSDNTRLIIDLSLNNRAENMEVEDNEVTINTDHIESINQIEYQTQQNSEICPIMFDSMPNNSTQNISEGKGDDHFHIKSHDQFKYKKQDYEIIDLYKDSSEKGSETRFRMSDVIFNNETKSMSENEHNVVAINDDHNHQFEFQNQDYDKIYLNEDLPDRCNNTRRTIDLMLNERNKNLLEDKNNEVATNEGHLQSSDLFNQNQEHDKNELCEDSSEESGTNHEHVVVVEINNNHLQAESNDQFQHRNENYNKICLNKDYSERHLQSSDLFNQNQEHDKNGLYEDSSEESGTNHEHVVVVEINNNHLQAESNDQFQHRNENDNKICLNKDYSERHLQSSDLFNKNPEHDKNGLYEDSSEESGTNHEHVVVVEINNNHLQAESNDQFKHPNEHDNKICLNKDYSGQNDEHNEDATNKNEHPHVENSFQHKNYDYDRIYSYEEYTQQQNSVIRPNTRNRVRTHEIIKHNAVVRNRNHKSTTELVTEQIEHTNKDCSEIDPRQSSKSVSEINNPSLRNDVEKTLENKQNVESMTDTNNITVSKLDTEEITNIKEDIAAFYSPSSYNCPNRNRKRGIRFVQGMRKKSKWSMENKNKYEIATEAARNLQLSYEHSRQRSEQNCSMMFDMLLKNIDTSTKQMKNYESVLDSGTRTEQFECMDEIQKESSALAVDCFQRSCPTGISTNLNTVGSESHNNVISGNVHLDSDIQQSEKNENYDVSGGNRPRAIDLSSKKLKGYAKFIKFVQNEQFDSNEHTRHWVNSIPDEDIDFEQINLEANASQSTETICPEHENTQDVIQCEITPQLPTEKEKRLFTDDINIYHSANFVIEKPKTQQNVIRILNTQQRDLVMSDSDSELIEDDLSDILNAELDEIDDPEEPKMIKWPFKKPDFWDQDFFNHIKKNLRKLKFTKLPRLKNVSIKSVFEGNFRYQIMRLTDEHLTKHKEHLDLIESVSEYIALELEMDKPQLAAGKEYYLAYARVKRHFHVIGYLELRCIDKCYNYCSYKDYEMEINDNATSNANVGVQTIWTYFGYRRCHLATNLLDCALICFDNKGVKLKNVAFNVKTDDGFQFIKRFYRKQKIKLENHLKVYL